MREFTCAITREVGGTGRMKTVAAIVAATLGLAGCGAPKAVHNGNPAQPGPTQKIHLIWKGAEWKVKLNGGNEEDPKTATTKLNKDVGPTMFEVDIQGATQASFKDPGGLSVWTGDKLKPQSGINSTQILGPIVTKRGNQSVLTFWDLNQGDHVVLNYSLHFDSGPSVDPIIDNGGGGNREQ